MLRLGLPELVTWFCLGWTANRMGIYLSAAIGSTSPIWSFIVFILGVVGRVVCLVLMIASLERHLRTPAMIDQPAAYAVPDSVLRRQPVLTVLATTISSFLAVYAVWGLVDDEVSELFLANVVRHGLLATEMWSVDLRRRQTYGLVAAVAWLLKQAVQLVHRRRQVEALGLLATVLDGVFVFTSFLALIRIVSRLMAWLRDRVVWSEAELVWHSLLASLPELRLPWALTLPDVVRRVGSWVSQTFLPGVGMGVLLPLMWLALTAVVFGWSDFENHIPARPGRVADLWEAMPRPVQRVLLLVSGDVRLKWLPVLHALQLLWRAGPRFLGAYLVVATVLRAVSRLMTWGYITARGPVGIDTVLLTEPVTAGIVSGFTAVVGCALYAAAFDRSLAAALEGPVQREISTVP